MAQAVKCPPAVRNTWVGSLGWEDPLEKEMATYSSILTWRIPWTRSLAGYSPWGRKELDTTERLHFLYFLLLRAWIIWFVWGVFCYTKLFHFHIYESFPS